MCESFDVTETTPAADRLRAFIARFMRRENLTRSEASKFLGSLLDKEASDGQIGAALVALAMKGETVDELTGIASAMRSRAVPLKSGHERFLDTAGTGSSDAKTFNVSTAAAFVIAAAGLPVAKHGNRAVTSRSGSSDVLTALGVGVKVNADVSEKCLTQLGVCFMFAPLYHGTTARVAAIRGQLGIRTVFNLLGPLTNPAGAPYQLVGVCRRELVEPLARTLAALGTTRAWVVHGLDGLDEVTLAERTVVAEAEKGAVRLFEIGPEDLGLQSSSLANAHAQDAAASAQIIREVFSGDRKDEARDLVVANAAAGIFIGGLARDLREAAEIAASSIDSGAAAEKLQALVEATSV